MAWGRFWLTQKLQNKRFQAIYNRRLLAHGSEDVQPLRGGRSAVLGTALPHVVQAVKGQITIRADGGVRSRGDVLKLLALGADAVMIGRPVVVAAIGGAPAGRGHLP